MPGCSVTTQLSPPARHGRGGLNLFKTPLRRRSGSLGGQEGMGRGDLSPSQVPRGLQTKGQGLLGESQCPCTGTARMSFIDGI